MNQPVHSVVQVQDEEEKVIEGLHYAHPVYMNCKFSSGNIESVMVNKVISEQLCDCLHAYVSK